MLLGLSTTAILGNGRVEGVQFKGGGSIPADLVVIAAGIRPNVELGDKAGLEVKRGIVVNDYMETSHPDIFAVGECVQHNGICYGLVAPLLEQGKVLAATITGNKGPELSGKRSRRQAEDHGRGCFLRGRVQRQGRWLRSRALRRSVARHLQEADAQERQARRRRSWWAMPATAIATWIGCASGPISRPCASSFCSRSRPRTRASMSPDGRQRDRVRLHGRDQGHDHPRHP